MAKKKNLMKIENARNPLQIENMKKIAGEDFCPFCPEHLNKYHEPPILRKGAFWSVTPNMYPYDNTAHHILFITHKHISDTKDITPPMWEELLELQNWYISENEIECGTLIIRSGDMKKNGATVLHLHAQFIVGADPKKPVITRVG